MWPSLQAWPLMRYAGRMLIILVVVALWTIGVDHAKLRMSTGTDRDGLPLPTTLIPPRGPSSSTKCGCSGLHLTSTEAAELEASADSTTLVALRKPSRRFHSNHWFHDGEYFVSMHSNAALLHIVQKDDAIVVLANEAKFVRQLTHVAAFLLLLALSPDGSARRLEVFEPTYLTVRVDADNKRWGSFASYGPGFVYDRSRALLEPDRQFRSIKFGARNGQKKICHCGKLVDFIGRTSTRSKQWFEGPKEVNEMRNKAASLCAPALALNLSRLDPLGSILRSWPVSTSKSLPSSSGPDRDDEGVKVLKLVVYQRNSNRKFSDLGSLLDTLAAGLANGNKNDQHTRWHIDVLTHDEDMQPCLLHRALASADVFLTTHGFQATALMFMKPGSVLLEVFPYKYWKDSYIALSAQFGVHHRWIQNQVPTSASRQILRLVPQSACMHFNRCRSHARADNIAMPPSHIEFVLRVAQQVRSGTLGALSAESPPPGSKSV